MIDDVLGSTASEAEFLQTLFELAVPKTFGGEVLGRITSDIGSVVGPTSYFIPKDTEVLPQLGLVDCSGHRLGAKELIRLQRPMVSFRIGRHVENDRVGMKVRCRVSVDWPRGVMFEHRRSPEPGCLRPCIASHAGLCVPLQVVECLSHGLPVSVAHALISPD